MLGGVKLRVCYSHERNCFAYLNSKYSTNNEQAQCVQVLCAGRRVILWAVFGNGVAEGTLAVHPAHCRLLDLRADLDIYVSPYSDVSALNRLYIVPDSPDDQEIVEQNAELLQLNLLDQLRLVVKDQRSIVWISTSLPIVFTPKQTGLLVNHSMVIVKMDAFMNHSYTNPIFPNKTSQKDANKMFNNVEIILDGLLKPYYDTAETKVLRGFPIEGDATKNIVHPYRIYLHEDLLPKRFGDGKKVVVRLDIIPTVVTDVKSREEDVTSSNELIDPIFVEIIPIDDIIYKSLSQEIYNEYIPTALIPASLNSTLNIEIGQKLIVTFNCDIGQPENIQIMAFCEGDHSEDDIVEKFKQSVVDSTNAGNTFMINNGIVIQQKQIMNGSLCYKLRPDKLRFTVLNSESLRHCSVTAKCLEKLERMTVSKKSKIETEYESKNYCRSVALVEELVNKTILHIEFEISREAHFKGVSEIKGNVLITGTSGSGKSSLCQIVSKETTFWSYTLHCRSLRGRKDIPEILGRSILMCQERSPALLICDDVDSLVPPDTEGGAPQDIAYYNRLAVVLKHMLQVCSGVCVLMTAVNIKSLHPVLREFRGRPLFTAHFEIPELQQSERLEFLKHLLDDNVRNDYYVDDDSVIKMAMDTPGQTFRDLLDYVNRKIYKAVKKKYANPSDERPCLLEDVGERSEVKDDFDIWGPLGGLEEAKQQLTECIFWPIMYPALFPSQSCGILLFGPPGTGKSFIGSCLARLANMNFVSVKGPELLSKYIGQSEKAVRDIFDKADMKRPCILFFDEFDSLAPKRGHDSTGVTDRVVNQLLVRLDGAEGGTRGPVVAATSRPDLIDPALLRPGRLDHHIYCPLPDQSGRVEVLRTLAASVDVSEDVELEGLAERTEGFSPADLKALLVTAQLTALEKQLESSDGGEPESVVVRAADVESALRETRPSLSRQQRLFYRTVYKRFRGERLTDEEAAEERVTSQLQRVTLA